MRQGDVLIVEVTEIPQEAKKTQEGTVILAYGEVTGHHHTVYADKKTLKVREVGGITYIALTIPAPLKHQEHKTLEIPMGIWKMSMEVEYDPFSKKMRKVVD